METYSLSGSIQDGTWVSHSPSSIALADLQNTYPSGKSRYLPRRQKLISQLAANGPSILTKIRLVAVTLLDAVPAQAYDDPSVQGMAAYLLGMFYMVTVLNRLTCRFLEYHDFNRGSVC